MKAHLSFARGRAGLSALICLWIACEGFAESPSFPDFKIESAREYMQKVAHALQAPPADQAELYLMQARLRSQLGEQGEAERLARESLALSPTRAEILSFLGDLFIRQDRLDEARTCLRKAVQLDGTIQGGYRRLGMVLDQLGETDGAREAFDTAVRSTPDDAAARLLLGRFLLAQDQATEAAVHLKKACELDPESPNAFYALSQAQTRMGNSEAAQTAFERFQTLKRTEKLALDAENAARDNDRETRAIAAGFHTEVARFYARRQQADFAEAHLRQAVRIAPRETSSHETLAALYLQTGRLADARPILEQMTELRPNDATYRVNLGTLLLQLKDYSAAVEQLKRTLQLDPKQTQALHNLARFYLGARQHSAEALDLCRRLVDLQPTAANYDLLAWACYANGQMEQARTASSRSIEKDPNHAAYRERYQRLQQLP